MKTIVYSSPYVPPEWIEAHGLTPCRILPKGAGSHAPVRPMEGVCPYMRAFVNTAAGMPNVSGIVLATVCDQMRHAADIPADAPHVPTFLFNVPSVWQTPSAHGLYQSELMRLGRFLATAGGSTPSADALAAVMDDYEQRRARLYDTGSDEICRAVAQYRHADWIPGASRESQPRKAIPLAFLGGPLTREDFEIYDIVRQCGGQVALDGTEEGGRTLPARFDRRRYLEDPIGELAAAYFGSIPDIFQRPNSGLFQWIERNLRPEEIKGVILLRQVWCDKWHAEVQRIRTTLKVPLLDIDLDAQPCGARHRNRIQAFMESLR